jgi:hypothetical protein
MSAHELHEAPDPGAVRADIGLHLGGGLADGGHVGAEQLRAPVEEGHDQPGEVGVWFRAVGDVGLGIGLAPAGGAVIPSAGCAGPSTVSRMDLQSDTRHQSNNMRVLMTGTVSALTNSGRL